MKEKEKRKKEKKKRKVGGGGNRWRVWRMEEPGEVKVSQVDTPLTVTSQALRGPYAPGT